MGEESHVHRRVLRYIKEEIGNDSNAIGLELLAGLAGVVSLGVYEGSLIFQSSPQHAWRYASLTTLPSFLGKSIPRDQVIKNLLRESIPAKGVPEKEAVSAITVRNIQAGRHLIALVALVGVTIHIGTGIERGRQKYRSQLMAGREPPLVAPSVIRISHRSPPTSLTLGQASSTFHVAFEDENPWKKTASSSAASWIPRRWWTRPQWAADPREWRNVVGGGREGGGGGSGPLFLEAEVTSVDRPGCLPLEIALKSLKAAKRAAVVSGGSRDKKKSVIRVLLGDDTSRPGLRMQVEESGMTDIIIDGETAVALAAMMWMEKTSYANEWAALAAQRGKEEAEKARQKNAVLRKWEEICTAVGKVPVPHLAKQPLKWVYDSWEGLGRQLRWLAKGGVTVRDAFDEYKVVVLVHDADMARLSQRSKLKALLHQAGWDVWGPGSSTSRLVQEWNAPVPILVYCQDDATTIERARFLVRAGRPRELTCAVLEEPEASSPWLDQDENRPTVISVADVHEGLFDFVRLRVKQGHSIAQIQQELDTSMGIIPPTPTASSLNKE